MSIITANTAPMRVVSYTHNLQHLLIPIRRLLVVDQVVRAERLGDL